MHVAVEVIRAIVGALFAIAIVIAVHEWGHYKVARILGFVVERFSIGFGRPLWQRQNRQGTEFWLGWFPLGGYVKFRQSGDKAFAAHPVYKRMLVVMAGIAVNLLCATAIYTVIYGVGFQSPKPIVGQVVIDGMADKAGLQPGDTIEAINGEPVRTWPRILMKLLLALGDEHAMKVRVMRGDRVATVSLPLSQWRIEGLKPQLFQSLGFMPDKHSPMVTISSPWYRSWMTAGAEVSRLFVFNAIMVKKLLFHELPPDLLGGPMSIFEQAGRASLQGVIYYFSFVAYLSIMLALINCLPIPLLDGGQFLLLIIEACWRRPISNRGHLLAQRIGFVIIALLLIQAVLNDIQRLFT